MIPDDETMRKIIRFRTNFFLYGPRASGKTTYLKFFLDQLKIPYIYLNCTFADKKVNFFKLLNHELDKFFISKLKKIQIEEPKDFQIMLNFSISKNKNLEEYQQQQDKVRLIYPLKKQIQNVQSWIELIQNLDLQLVQWLKQIYIFMDNIEELNVSPNFLTSFYYSCQQQLTNYKIPFIFCGINLPRKIYSVDKPFRNITSFCMRKPIQLMQKIIKTTISQVLQKEYKDHIKKEKNFKQEIQNFSQRLMKQVYAAFEAIQSDLNKIKKISQVIALKVNQMIKKQQHPSIDRCLTKIINRGDLKQILRQLTEQGPINDFIVNRRLNQNQNQVSSSEMNIQFYPMLLLASMHLAEYADQSQDTRRFKDYKQIKKSKLLKLEFKERKHIIQRIIAISESLQTIAKDNQKEKLLKHHSLDYYGCLQHLKQQKKIVCNGKPHSFMNGKISGLVKQDEVITFMKKNHMNYSQFTGKHVD